MENSSNGYDLYRDIQQRTDGEIYIGVLGPVRTGKSTFIKHFMDEMVLPYMEDENAKERARDELPQSAGGKTITTTEPKFVPNEAAKIVLKDDIAVSVRLIDCVGYMVEGAAGHMEEETERMVKTPWFDSEIPFTKAAEIGTDKVMNEHSTIGLVVTTDGSFGEIPRENYIEAEERTIQALKKIHKPFLVLLNCQKPYSADAQNLVRELTDKYNVTVMAVNCEQLKKEDIRRILEKVLYEFPISCMEFYLPEWAELLEEQHPLKVELIQLLKKFMVTYSNIKDCKEKTPDFISDSIKKCKMDEVNPADGTVRVELQLDDKYYYEMLTDMIGDCITDEYQLIHKLKEYAVMKKEYSRVLEALQMVRISGYGVVTPGKEEIQLERPELIKHGNKYGVKIKATSPSIHMIRANIETEIAPIIGTEEQAQDLIRYIDQPEDKESIWDTNIFGKTVEQLVNDGITAKVAVIGEESQLKLQDTMQKIVNDSNGGMVCIII